MYRAALVRLTESAEVGDERTRIAYICHSMREVMNRVLRPMGITLVQGSSLRVEIKFKRFPIYSRSFLISLWTARVIRFLFREPLR